MATIFTRPEDGFCLETFFKGGPPRLKEWAERGKPPPRTPSQRLVDRYVLCPLVESSSFRLQDDFRQSGLQVIVKSGGIQLSPNHAQYEPAEWKVSGFLNEHIVATALIAVDMENVAPCSVEFRQETDVPMRDDDCWHERRHVDPLNPSMDSKWGGVPISSQDIGSVNMHVGRLIAFPNVMEHRLSPFRLVDPTRCGHFRLITLDLVDPNYHICSTRNVPAQQHEWWAEVVEGISQQTGLPLELCKLIVEFCHDWPVRHELALQHKIELQAEFKLREMARIYKMYE